MRVIAGALRGRRLRAPRSGARPTADRVREAVFGALGDVADCAVLDLYAGSGALGIEALSRGAERAVFVESAREVASVLRRNLADLDLTERSSVRCADVVKALPTLARQAHGFDLVFADPPYASAEREAALAGLVAPDLLRAGATVVVETGRRHPLADVAGLQVVRERRYGDTLVTYLEVSRAGSAREIPRAEEQA